MTDHTDLITRLRKGYEYGDSGVVLEAASALEAAQAEIERLTADRRVLQADGKHPAPCAKFCEATAFTIELRRASAEIEREKECTALAVTQAEKLIQQRNAALARLAELTKQEPVMVYDGRCIWDCGDGGHQDVTMLKMIAKGTKLYAAAGASPVQPAQSEKELRHRIRVHLTNRNYYSHQEFCTKLEELMAEGAAPSIKLTK